MINELIMLLHVYQDREVWRTQYLQQVEGFPNEEGRVRHRVVANPGRLEGLNPAKLDSLINGLNRAIGCSDNTAFPVGIESSKAYGNVFALHELWKDLRFDRVLGRAMRPERRKIEADALVSVIVFNRLRDSENRLDRLRWLDSAAMPEMLAKVEHHISCAPWGTGLSCEGRIGPSDPLPWTVIRPRSFTI